MKKNKWRRVLNGILQLEDCYGPDVVYRTAIDCLIVVLSRDLDPADVAQAISEIVNEELINFDVCNKIVHDRVAVEEEQQKKIKDMHS
jgi:hypothetical protein